MTELREYRPEDDPNPERMDGKMSRHRSRWFHDMLKALLERGETELAHHLETQLLSAYFGKDWELPFPHEEFDRRFRDCMQTNQTPPPKQTLAGQKISVERQWWFDVILVNTDDKRLKVWMQMGAEAGAPEDFLETLIELYNHEWNDEAILNPDHLKSPEYTDQSLGYEVNKRCAELCCFEEIAKQEGKMEKADLIHREYERINNLKVFYL